MEDRKARLTEYFKKNLQKGYSAETLRIALLKQGYSPTLIADSLGKAHIEMAKKVPEFKEKPKIKYELLDENNTPVVFKVPWWKRLLGL